jgi:hypothetical protein
VFDLFEYLGSEKLMIVLQLILHLQKGLIVIVFKNLPFFNFTTEISIEALEEGIQVILEIAL